MFLLQRAGLQASILRFFSLSLKKSGFHQPFKRTSAAADLQDSEDRLPGPEAADPWICIRNVGCPPPGYFPNEGRHR